MLIYQKVPLYMTQIAPALNSRGHLYKIIILIFGFNEKFLYICNKKL